jgi:hypothetical protein
MLLLHQLDLVYKLTLEDYQHEPRAMEIQLGQKIMGEKVLLVRDSRFQGQNKLHLRYYSFQNHSNQ